MARIDWSKYDQAIVDYMPNYCAKEFRNLYAPDISYSAICNRAKFLGVKPKKYRITEKHKKATSNGARKKLSSDQYDYISKNLNKIPRTDIAKHLGISLHLVTRASKDLGIQIDTRKWRKFSADRSKKHIHKATQASVNKIMNMSESEKAEYSKKKSNDTKKLWEDPEYRLKVRNGIKAAYNNTDLRDRLSTIGKDRFKNDKSVRDALINKSFETKNSKLNDTISIKLDNLNIKHDREFEIGNYSFDFRVGNILLEVNGNYWHNLPENIRNDRAKSTYIEKYTNYKLKVLWENEAKSVRCNDRLLELLEIKKPDQKQIKLNELTIDYDVDKLESRKFLTSFHYLGDTSRKKYVFGLRLHGELVSVVVFGNLIRQNIDNNCLELSRMCRHPYFYNKNMMSWFLSKCTKYLKSNYNYSGIISYADKRYHDGAVYKASNWGDCGDTQPDYCYMTEDNIPMHKKTLYNRAVKKGMKEREYAELMNMKKTKIGSKRKFKITF